jgi:hypothetical protein
MQTLKITDKMLQKRYFKIKIVVCTQRKSLSGKTFFYVHFVTKVSLYFRKLCKNPASLTHIVKKILFDPYTVHDPKSYDLCDGGRLTQYNLLFSTLLQGVQQISFCLLLKM